MIYEAGVEDIEPNHWVAWAFARPGFTGKGRTAEAAIAHLQSLLSDGEVKVVEQFHAYPSPQDPEYLVNAFFEDDRRPLTDQEISFALDELVLSRRTFLAQVEPVPSDVLARIIPGERFESIYGIIRHVAVAEWWYCQRIGGVADWKALPADSLDALATSRANTRRFLPTLVDDQRTITLMDETWSARKVLRRTLWHERDHTQHIAERLREFGGI